MLELTADRQRALAELVAAWVARHSGLEPAEVPPPTVLQAEVVLAGRPGLVDVLAEVGGRIAHAVVGLRRPGEEARTLRAGDDPVLGLVEDDLGLAVGLDALADADLAPLVLAAVTGTTASPGPVSVGAEDAGAVVLSFGEKYSLTVLPWLAADPEPSVAFLVALDEVGFNHLAAPIALWRRAGRDLGFVQEQLAGPAGGYALAQASLRDLFARGGAAEAAGGDFAPEARALGTMTARMHLACDRAFGRRPGDVAAWADEVGAVVRAADPSLLEVERAGDTLSALARTELRCATLRTHGDFHLGRTARTDHGWVLADCRPGGVPPGADGPLFRSPLADVADLLWSLHLAATEAAAERDPAERGGVGAPALDWEARNRRAFLSGYLATPGIGGVVPADRAVLGDLLAAFELERAARTGRH
jgi:predicted trehalose synthase